MKGYPAVAGLVKTKEITFLNMGDIFDIFRSHSLPFGKSRRFCLVLALYYYGL
jgi:hypothetical protein